MKIQVIILALICMNIKFIKCSYNLSNSEDYIVDNIKDILHFNYLEAPCQLYVKRGDRIDTSHLRIAEFTKYYSKTHNLLPSAAKSLFQSNFFNPVKKIVIFVHGFQDGPFQTASLTVTHALRKLNEYNVLALDSSSAMSINYALTVANMENVGNVLGTFLYELTELGIEPEDIHLVGHSLGAHISGFAGKAFQRLKDGRKLARITGLDPANPCFNLNTPEHRLSDTDATFVDVIHTNPGYLGINISIGHVDFRPNGDRIYQPGCNNMSESHSRAWQYFAESVGLSNNFIGIRCDSWGDFIDHKCVNNSLAVMGFHAPITARGDHYLITKYSANYGLGILGTLNY